MIAMKRYVKTVLNEAPVFNPELLRHEQLERVQEQFEGEDLNFNVRSINRNTSFHGMGMIWIVRKSVMSHLAYKRIPRKKIRTDEKAKLLKAGEVTI